MIMSNLPLIYLFNFDSSIIQVDAPTTTVATTTIRTTTSPATSSTVSTSTASTTVESTTQATSTELTTESSSTTLEKLVEDSQCVDLPPGMFIEGVPISNVTYDVSFRYVCILLKLLNSIM